LLSEKKRAIKDKREKEKKTTKKKKRIASETMLHNSFFLTISKTHKS